ncbi:pilus assembly protein TadG-related protein [Arsenicicoccus dermatophilus]|uniref:pilus assembly protein TadG-related protein n=1 Tax=Arsenicicoccus dermatophilus TaxID=1076331 RepID=UPI001F4D2C96|nr:pilus assembly protein TadG-related protein [Arsenicicoccus dermatophilus]MCH8613555.1 pilus assembly protein TadG-related protein [Arsenicicoccus dermatophilus]
MTSGLPAREGERGSISLLSLGFTLVAALLIVVGIDVTAVQLARTQLWDVADAAALDAADRVDEARVYAGGLGREIPITAAGVGATAQQHLGAQSRPADVDRWSLGGATGSPDGRTAVVQVVGHVRLPVVGSVVEAFGGGMTVVVESRARSRVR